MLVLSCLVALAWCFSLALQKHKLLSTGKWSFNRREVGVGMCKMASIRLKFYLWSFLLFLPRHHCFHDTNWPLFDGVTLDILVVFHGFRPMPSTWSVSGAILGGAGAWSLCFFLVVTMTEDIRVPSAWQSFQDDKMRMLTVPQYPRTFADQSNRLTHANPPWASFPCQTQHDPS